MSKYDELVSIYLKAKDEHENNGIMCQNFAHDLMKSIFRAGNHFARIASQYSWR